tara:strand:- start:1848 stop:2405 length:558 start_codon:yes stop_codon:yes gene_type:complete
MLQLPEVKESNPNLVNFPKWIKRDETNFIVIHSSLTKGSDDEGVESMRSLHMRQGCVDVGYHFIIRRNGVTDLGRPIHAIGNHCPQVDEQSVGICLIGGGDKNRKAKAPDYNIPQMESLAYICLSLVKIYPEAEIVGHNRFSPESKCPVFNIPDWWSEVSYELKQLHKTIHADQFPLFDELQKED